MSQDRLESLVPAIPADDENPFVEDVRHPATPVVLDAIDIGREFRERPVSVLCPGCGDVLARHRDGLPLRVARVEEHCTTCTTTLQRWTVVVIGTAYEQSPSPAGLQATVTSYWDEHLWAGITTGEGNPRTKEYSRLYTEQAAAFGWDWTVSCPLCRTAVVDLAVERLDYHHWSRTPDQGVCVCRTCHDAIDGQETDTDQDWQAQELGLRDNHDLQITRLALREQAVAGHDSLSTLVETLHERYNLVQSPGHVYALLSQTLSDQTVLGAVSDGYLLANVSAS
jgi:hypothetical protein